ncbi:MAG: ATP-dependent helicase [Phycisphaerae bacterium]
MSVNQLLEGLTEPQKEAVTHTHGPLLVLAGPGSGKTRVITHRTAYLARTVTEPRHILALTFTNKAANEMAERIRHLAVEPGVTCSTFHSLCARLLRTHADRAGLNPNFSIFDQTDQTAAMKQAIERCGKSTDNYSPANMVEAVSQAKNDMVLPEDYGQYARDWSDRAIIPIYEAYQQILAEQNALDFDDLLLKMACLLGQDAELRDQLQDRYRFVLVDEYQDTNHAQYLIARGLALDHENLCVTGDPDQSIYGWRGANIHNILEFEQDFPRAKVVRLEKNYRSTPQILTAADAVIRHNRNRKHKKLWTDNDGGPPVRVIEADTATQEADLVAEAISEHVASGGKYADAAVFYRINALSRLIEEALLKRHIPYQVARGVSFFQRKEVKDSLAYLRLAANPKDRVSFLRIVNVPPRGIGDTTIERITRKADQTGLSPLEVIADPRRLKVSAHTAERITRFAGLIGEIARMAAEESVTSAVRYAILHSGLRASWSQAKDDDAARNADELISDAAEYDRDHPQGGSLVDWLQQVSLMSEVDSVNPEMGAVTLMTLHAAKGLEFNQVFIIGVEDGLLPYRRQENREADMEEERRLCFVGMTRARRSLTLTCARFRSIRGRGSRSTRSVFLTELPREQVEWLVLPSDRVTEGDRGYDDQAAEAMAVRYADWQQGRLVRHEDYGLGQILWLRPAARGVCAGIRFKKDGSERTFVLEQAAAKLQLLEYDDWGWNS